MPPKNNAAREKMKQLIARGRKAVEDDENELEDIIIMPTNKIIPNNNKMEALPEEKKEKKQKKQKGSGNDDVLNKLTNLQLQQDKILSKYKKQKIREAEREKIRAATAFPQPSNVPDKQINELRKNLLLKF